MPAAMPPAGSGSSTDTGLLREAQQHVVLACEWTVLTLRRQGRGWVVVQRDRQRLCAPFSRYARQLKREHWVGGLASWRLRQANVLYRRDLGAPNEQSGHQDQPGWSLSVGSAPETVDAGLVPLENSHAGRVADVEALLHRTDVQVVGERWQPIHHCLLALPGQSLSAIRQAWSHPQALAQCDAYLRAQGIEADC